jgi:hypothetical protein
MKCTRFFSIILIALSISACNRSNEKNVVDIVFLHHSVGAVIWQGQTTRFNQAVNKISPRIASVIRNKPLMRTLFSKYNKEHGTKYFIKETIFPKTQPYGWKNYPYDYYNIWVKNAGEIPFMEEPTLESLVKDNDLIIFKHCYPVSNIKDETDTADINSEYKTISNYKLQYMALRNKLHQFPDTKFILFTGAAQVKSRTDEEEGKRASEFFNWVINEWDIADDNIFLWDLYNLQTEGDLYFKDEYAVSGSDSHPNERFALDACTLLFHRIIDVIENNAMGTHLTGEQKESKSL